MSDDKSVEPAAQGIGIWHGFEGDVASTVKFGIDETTQEVMDGEPKGSSGRSPYTDGGESAVSSGGLAFGQT